MYSDFFFSMRPLDEIKLIPFDTPIFFPSVMRSSAPENGWTGMCTRQPANSFLFLDFALPNKRQFWAYNETQKGSQFLICKDRSRLSAIADKKKNNKIKMATSYWNNCLLSLVWSSNSFKASLQLIRMEQHPRQIGLKLTYRCTINRH